MPHPEVLFGAISSGKEYPYNRQGTTNDAALRQEPWDVLAGRASLRGLTPEIRENTSGPAVHPMVVYGGEKAEESE
jgi:hypothetical protein